MREILEEIKYFKVKGRGCVPNLQGVSPVDRDRGDRLYVIWAVGRSGAESGGVEGGGR